jgi:hypothetical protein
MKISQFSQSQGFDFTHGKNCAMTNSWVELQGHGAFFSCDDDVSLIDAQITIKGNARLILGTGCVLRGRIILDDNSSLIVGDGL